MDCNHTTQDLCTLDAFQRNKYFYGKLLDEYHFQLEQNYMNRKRWQLNRLGLGMGVLCGLEVRVSDDGRKVIVQPGVAIDPCGREIIVPAAYPLEPPRQPTDARGRPEGAAIEGTVTLCLAYHECETDPVPVLACGCDVTQESMPSTVCERYRLLVRPGLPSRRPGLISPEQCRQIFPEDPREDFDRRLAVCHALTTPCADPKDTCVVLATITLPEGNDRPLTVDTCTYRSVVYSNAMLLDLILCLARRVDACCSEREAPTKTPVAVEAVEFIDLNDDVTGRLEDPGKVPEFRDAQAIHQIQVTFSGPVDHQTVTAGGTGADPDTFSFLVISEQKRQFVPGAIVPKDDRTVRFELEKSPGYSAFPPGTYQVTLFGEKDPADQRPAVTGRNGARLDGEPTRLPSGDGTEGGNFVFRFRILD